MNNKDSALPHPVVRDSHSSSSVVIKDATSGAAGGDACSCSPGNLLLLDVDMEKGLGGTGGF